MIPSRQLQIIRKEVQQYLNSDPLNEKTGTETDIEARRLFSCTAILMNYTVDNIATYLKRDKSRIKQYISSNDVLLKVNPEYRKRYNIFISKFHERTDTE